MNLLLYIARSVQISNAYRYGMCYSINLQVFGHPVKVKHGGITNRLYKGLVFVAVDDDNDCVWKVDNAAAYMEGKIAKTSLGIVNRM